MTDPLFDIGGKVIVVAGAASGLGRSLSSGLAGRGARLVLDRLEGPELESQARALGPDALAVKTDVTREDEANALIDAAVARHGQVDGVVNTVGILRIAPATELPVEQLRASLDINVTGAFLLSRAAARVMKGRGGRIVHLASVSSYVSNVNYAAYSPSKAALSQLVRVLGREWASDGINVNAVGPAVIETPMSKGMLSDPKTAAAMLSVIPMGRVGTAEDLLATVVLLLAPGGSYITGQTIYVDGGRTLA
ncbi:MAG: SDR family oxidoreductase [Hyphomicrobiaceae bacterium]|nr:SDR family oxidoreductase [Hyphomicrobiaceae bacterium]